MEEVEGAFGFGCDVGEGLLDPGPGKGFDFEIAGFELGISVWGPFLGWLPSVGGDNVGLIVVVSYSFTLSLRAVAFPVSSAVFEPRCLHHDLNGVA